MTKLSLLVGLVFLSATLCGAGEIKIESFTPDKLYLPADGKQITVVVRGKGLSQLHSYSVEREGKPWKSALVQVREALDNRVILLLALAPRSGNEGSGYRLIASDTRGEKFTFNLPIEGVGAEDSRAVQPSLDDLLRSSSRNVLTVDQELVPQVREVVPSPLQIPANGEPVPVTLKGANLSKVTQLRVRRADKDKYQPGKGMIPFEFTAHGLTLELVASPRTKIGEEYRLDVLMQKYRVTSIPFVVVPAP
jgi:hypothetical protein